MTTNKVLEWLKTEKTALDKKISILEEFLSDEDTKDNNEARLNHLGLLHIQLGSMKIYSECLNIRIKEY